MKKTTILIVLSILFICCKTSEKPIDISFSKSDEDVTLFYSIKTNRVWAIGLPFDLEIENPSSKEHKFLNYSYLYGNGIRGKAMKLYLKKDGGLVKQGYSQPKVIGGKQTNSYLVKSKHFVDSTKFNRTFFKPYIEKMKALNQDTLNIGTISDLEANHKDLLENLVQEDSMFILFVSQKADDRFRRETWRVKY